MAGHGGDGWPRVLGGDVVKVYLAGKIGADDWRHTIVDGLEHAAMALWNEPFTDDMWAVRMCDRLEGSVYGGHDYTGPFFMPNCGHTADGCANDPHTHNFGAAWVDSYCSCDDATVQASCGHCWIGGRTDRISRGGHLQNCGGDAPTRKRVYRASMSGIAGADVVFAWIEDPTAHGTLVELGYAAAQRAHTGRPQIWVASPRAWDALWFAYETADVRYPVFPSGPRAAWDYLLREKKRGAIGKARRSGRESIPKSLRWVLMEKFNYTCAYCGRRHHSSSIGPDNRPWHLDHREPFSKGGADGPENLVLSCEQCNLRKHTQSPVAGRWAP